MTEQLNKLWGSISAVLQREVFREVNIMTKKEDDKILLELRGKDHQFWSFLTFYVSESDIITAKHSVYTNVPLVSNDTTLIDEDEEYILGTDEFSITVALLKALKTTEQLTKSYQSDEQFVIVGSTCGNTQEYDEVAYIDTVKKLLPLVEGLNKLFPCDHERRCKGVCRNQPDVL